MNYATLGIVGHVDHGKTALVKALTGVDTDRLKEEKERGISIALGYAHLALPDGRIGMIDVPGHEKFIRTMVSGATGIEAVLLVVDVNEGVKPQTLEHLEIAELLGIRRGIIAVTKCDAAQPGRREAMAEELEILCIGTFLEDAPHVFTSAVSGEGLESLKELLNDLVRHGEAGVDEGFAYLPIDRAFSMAGFGTVVTGTLRRGALRVGDEVELYPHGIRARIRELQTHNEFTETSSPGFRTAVNLRGVDKNRLGRGDVLATPGTLSPASILDVHLHMLKSARTPLKQRQNLRLLFGTKETFARVHLLDRSEVQPGEDCFLQFRVEEEVAVLNREHFIVRTYSPMFTIGGGVILDSSVKGYRRFDEGAIEHLRVMALGSPSDVILETLLAAGAGLVESRRLQRDLRLTREGLETCLKDLPVVPVGKGYLVHAEIHETLCRDLLACVEQFHAGHPTRKGLPKDRVNAELGIDIAPPLLDHLIEDLTGRGLARLDQGNLKRQDFDPEEALSPADRSSAEEIEGAFRDGALQPPGLADVVGDDRERSKMYRYLLENKTLVAISGGGKTRSSGKSVVFHREAIDGARRLLGEAFSDSEGFSASDAKTALDTTRKFVIPLLEHLDSTGFTKRMGDYRVLTGR